METLLLYVLLIVPAQAPSYTAAMSRQHGRCEAIAAQLAQVPSNSSNYRCETLVVPSRLLGSVSP